MAIEIYGVVMSLVVLGVVLLLLRWFELPPVVNWPLWVMFLPFLGALAWWAWSDASGRTRRLQEEQIKERQRDRRRKALEALGPQDQGGKRRGR